MCFDIGTHWGIKHWDAGSSPLLSWPHPLQFLPLPPAQKPSVRPQTPEYQGSTASSAKKFEGNSSCWLWSSSDVPPHPVDEMCVRGGGSTLRGVTLLSIRKIMAWKLCFPKMRMVTHLILTLRKRWRLTHPVLKTVLDSYCQLAVVILCLSPLFGRVHNFVQALFGIAVCGCMFSVQIKSLANFNWPAVSFSGQKPHIWRIAKVLCWGRVTCKLGCLD